MTTEWSAVLDGLLYAAGAVGVAMTLLWLVSLRIRDVSIVDIFWGSAFVVIAWVCFWRRGRDPSLSSWVPLVLVTLRGARLTLYLAWRNLGKGEDYRYAAMRERDPRFAITSLGKVFYLQGFLALLVSLPVQASQALSRADAPERLWVVAGAAAWAVGLFFEAVGDAQLARFKADPENRGRVMDRGLWRYTRHPNYFGDFMIWWGLYLTVAPVAWWSVLGPLVMTTFLLKVSGVAMLEKTIGERRPGYAEYAAKTSAFFPWPPKG